MLIIDNERGRPTYSLEILSNLTKVKPVWVDGKLQREYQADISVVHSAAVVDYRRNNGAQGRDGRGAFTMIK